MTSIPGEKGKGGREEKERSHCQSTFGSLNVSNSGSCCSKKKVKRAHVEMQR